jgi:hypothetical protein
VSDSANGQFSEDVTSSKALSWRPPVDVIVRTGVSAGSGTLRFSAWQRPMVVISLDCPVDPARPLEN